jgi:hypothetical protein
VIVPTASFEVPQSSRPPRARVAVAAALAFGVLGLFAAIRLWNRPHLPAYIVYDVNASREASLADMFCAPEIRAECQQPVIEGEAGFRHALALAHDEIPDCRGVYFLVDTGPSANSPATDVLLAAARKQVYWLLSVDYHVGTSGQSFTLQRNNNIQKRTEFGGDSDALNLMSNACRIAREGGFHNYW